MAKDVTVERVYGPLADEGSVAGVTWDGERLWFASPNGVQALDPQSGEVTHTLEVPADAGTAFDGRYLYQLAEERIDKIDPETGEVLATIAAPGVGRDSGMTWAEGTLWVGQYRDRKIIQIDPETGATLRTLQSDRFVTGVTWVGGELWHATSQEGDSELRRVDPESGEVHERLPVREARMISGLASDGTNFYAGGGSEPVIRKFRRPGLRGSTTS